MPVVSTCAVRSFRCLQDQKFGLGAGSNWLVGDNASGKTSVLEALYFLGRGRSFRTAQARQCARFGSDGWQVEAAQRQDDAPPLTSRVRWRDGVLEFSGNGQRTTVVELARAFPVQLIEPGMHRIVEEGPAYRRQFLDWGMFHVEPRYLDVWRRYARALRQRNALLRRRGASPELDAWSREFSESAAALQQLRAKGVAALQSVFAARSEALDLPQARLQLLAGWDESQPLAEQLSSREESDRRNGHTGIGPHRAEVRLEVDSQHARAHISRGQQKVLLMALHLAQADLLHAANGRWPLLLIDDFAAELAPRLQRALGSVLSAYAGQSVITSLMLPESGVMAHDSALFHVEHGSLRRA